MDELFSTLIFELGQLLDCPCALAEEGKEVTAVRVMVDGTAFLISRQDAPAGLFTLHCSFGPLPEDVGARELLRILQKNTELASRCAGALGVDGDPCELIYSCHASLRGTTAVQLLQGLRRCVQMSRSWREILSFVETRVPDSSPQNLVPFA